MKKTLEELKEKISTEKEFIDRQISNEYGKPIANKVIKELGLDECGYSPEKITKEDWDKLTERD